MMKSTEEDVDIADVVAGGKICKRILLIQGEIDE